MSRVLPIMFNTDMVKAILDGRKTVTRRILKLPKYIKEQENGLYTIFTEGTCYENQYLEQIVDYIKPPYQPGDILYVRETWAFMNCIGCNGDYRRLENPPPCYDTQAVEYDDGDSISDGCFIYRADCKTPERITWRPSIHMPKEAARIWLKVMNVRVERLQDITDVETEKEGAQPQNPFDYDVNKWPNKEHFKEIWNATIKKSDLESYGWEANPWVWVIEFERCEKPQSEERDMYEGNII